MGFPSAGSRQGKSWKSVTRFSPDKTGTVFPVTYSEKKAGNAVVANDDNYALAA